MRDKLGRFIKKNKCICPFKKGHTIRNTGRTHFKKGILSTPKPFKKGHIPWNKGKKYPQVTGKNNHLWKGRKISNGYILIYSPNHPFSFRNYVPEHRLVVEKQTGHYLRHTDLVHHINGVKDDNRPQNLMVFINHAYHSNFHRGFKINPKGIIFDGRQFTKV